MLNPLPLSFSASARTHSRHCFRVRRSIFTRCCSRRRNWPNLARRRGASLCAVPTIIRNLFRAFRRTIRPAIPTLEAIYCFGAPMAPAEKIRAKTSLCGNFVQVYGATILRPHQRVVGRRSRRAARHSRPRAAACDPAIGRRQRPGRSRWGIRASSACARRAWRNSVYGESASGSGDSFKDGWAYPGDIGAFDEEGFLRLLGRPPT